MSSEISVEVGLCFAEVINNINAQLAKSDSAYKLRIEEVEGDTVCFWHSIYGSIHVYLLNAGEYGYEIELYVSNFDTHGVYEFAALAEEWAERKWDRARFQIEHLFC